MKKRWVLLGALLFGLIPQFIDALPQLSEVVSGDVAVLEPDLSTLVIQAEDRSIIHYESFSVSLHEKVQFVQPSSSSTVLNRVTGNNPSEILGRIVSNGTVFLVNPNGVYFGRDAHVDVGSLIASTLDLSSIDFSKGRFEFSIQEGKGTSEISNLGTLTAREGGTVMLISPFIRNEGVIIAQAGKVLLAGSEKVILDFEGTGLIQFAVDGELELAMIEHTGSIEAMQVQIAMSCVHPLIEQVINTDGISIANSLTKQNGVVRLAASSAMKANTIEILAQKGSHLQINGLLNASSNEGIGGKVHLFGETLFLGATEINASGSLGGGEILIGGGLCGEGPYFTAQHTQVTSLARISSDAIFQGDGGKVVIWSDGKAVFNGTISSMGGAVMGSGGMVETSGVLELNVESGKVSTIAPCGKRGTWLLDPMYIEIVAESTSTSLTSVASCLDAASNYSSSGTNFLGGITNSVINQSTTNVVLCAAAEGGTIVVSAPIDTGVDITLSVASSGSIVLNKSIATRSGVISLEGPVFVGSGFIALDTTNNGACKGADIVCTGSVDGGSSASNLVISAGVGEVIFEDSIGKNIPLQSLTVGSASQVIFTSDLMTNSTSTGVMIAPPVLLMGNVKIDTTKSGMSGGSAIALSGGVNGNYRLFLNAGTVGIVSIAAAGQETPLSALQMKACNIVLSGDVTANGGTLIFEGPVTINADISLTDTGPTGIIFEGTVNCSGGSFTLTLDAPIGRVSFLSTVGNLIPPSSVTISSHLIQLGGDVTISSTLTCNNALMLLGDITISAPIMAFEDTVDGSYDLTLESTSSGTITFSNIVGSIARLGTLTIVDVDTLSAQGIYAENITQEAAAGTCTYDEFLNTTGSTGVSLTGTGGFDFTGGIQTLNGGSVTIQSAGTITAASITDMAISGSFSQTGGGSVNWQGNIVTQGGDISFSGPFNLTGPVIISSGDTGAGAISFSSTVDGDYSLSLSAGFGDVNYGGTVGGTTPLQDIILTSAQDVTAGEIQALSYTQLGGYGTADYAEDLVTTGALGINISSNYVAFAGQSAGATLTTINGNIVINAEFGGINSLANPVQINVNGGVGTLFVGSASPAYFSGTGIAVKTLCPLRTNVPCYIDYNSTEYALTTSCQALY